MKSIKSAGDRFFAVMAYIIVILSIMSTTVMWNYLKGAFIPIGTYRYLLLAISLLLVLVTNSYNFKDLSFITLIICYLLVFIFFSQINPFKYFSNLCMPLTASLLIVFVYYQHGKGNLLLASYANIVLIVAGVSLFFYFFVTFWACGSEQLIPTITGLTTPTSRLATATFTSTSHFKTKYTWAIT